MQNTVIVLCKVHARNQPMVRYMQGSQISPNFFQIFAKFIVNSANFIKDFPQKLFKFI